MIYTKIMSKCVQKNSLPHKQEIKYRAKKDLVLRRGALLSPCVFIYLRGTIPKLREFRERELACLFGD